MLQGIEMGTRSLGPFGVQPSDRAFPCWGHGQSACRGVALLLGNDIAGGRVTPVLEVLDNPTPAVEGDLSGIFPDVFSACVVTRAQSQRLGEVVNLAETVLGRKTMRGEVPCVLPESAGLSPADRRGDAVSLPKLDAFLVSITPERVPEQQKKYVSLCKCLASVVLLGEAETRKQPTS